VVLHEGRVPGMAASYELNRNYQVRREMFRLDRNAAARVLMLGDSLTVQGEWNAMLGELLVANRGIDGDTSAGVLARVEDDADFRGDAVVIWIGTNDVLQGETAVSVVERIMQVARRKAKLTTEDKESTIKRRGRCEPRPWEGRDRLTQGSSEGVADWEICESKEQPKVGPKGEGAGATKSKKEAGLRPGSRAGAAFSNPSTSELARDSESTSPIRSADGPASSLEPIHSSLDSRKIFVLSLPPIARWWEGARERNETIREINSMLKANGGVEGYIFVDLHPVLADRDGFLRGDLTSDGVHLNAKGYMAVIQKLKEEGLLPRTEH
jgi:lysophospholipase L1-like esterase